MQPKSGNIFEHLFLSICHLLIPFPQTAFMQIQCFCTFCFFCKTHSKNNVSTVIGWSLSPGFRPWKAYTSCNNRHLQVHANVTLVTCHNLAFSFSLSTWLLYIFFSCSECLFVFHCFSVLHHFMLFFCSFLRFFTSCILSFSWDMFPHEHVRFEVQVFWTCLKHFCAACMFLPLRELQVTTKLVTLPTNEIKRGSFHPPTYQTCSSDKAFFI